MNHIESLKKHIADGTLIRGKWTGEDEQGRRTACILTAMAPQCGELKSPEQCPLA